MSSFYHIPISDCPPLFHRQVLELWNYIWDPVLQNYQRISFRAIHVTESVQNPPDVFNADQDFYLSNEITVQSRLNVPVRRPPPPPPGMPGMPPRPPPPDFGNVRSPRRATSSPESPESPECSEAYSPTDTPSKRMTPASPPWSPDRLHCDRSAYVARQDHLFALPVDCPARTPPKPPANPALEPQATPPRRRRAPSPPIGRGRGILRNSPYLRPPGGIPSDQSAFRPVIHRARNLFTDFVPNIMSAGSRSPSPQPLPPDDIFQEVYSHTRHPIDDRSHLTVIPSWAIKAEEEKRGECVICYGNDTHLQIRCQTCGSQKVCCICVVGVYQSINSCPTCRFRGEF